MYADELDVLGHHVTEMKTIRRLLGALIMVCITGAGSLIVQFINTQNDVKHLSQEQHNIRQVQKEMTEKVSSMQSDVRELAATIGESIKSEQELMRSMRLQIRRMRRLRRSN